MSEPQSSSDHDVSAIDISKTDVSKTDVSKTQEPPTSLFGILRKLGPGLIIAGSIVGSGELIATTKTGAEAGFWLLWLILIGCVIKVFVQVEFGRFTIINSQTAMTGMNSVPGPRIGRGNWLMWYWLIMFLAGLGQLGGIVGGVGQALSISAPLTADGKLYNEIVSLKIEQQVHTAEYNIAKKNGNVQRAGELSREKEVIQQRIDALGKAPESIDAKIWAAIVTVITIVLLVNGRYSLIQIFSTTMVAAFTMVTIVNLVGLQSTESWAIGSQDIIQGMSFQFTPEIKALGEKPLLTALAAFGIIGVGASELIAYPYWCLEKGYARYTGPRQEGEAWARRARGWMRVLRWDAWCSMVIYTFATIAFYLLGASVLGRTGLNPEKAQMIHTLAVMYKPVFGPWAEALFLFGAFAVLYSTFFVATAGNTRMSADAVGVFGLSSGSDQSRKSLIRAFSILFPAVSYLVYLLYSQPVTLVLISGSLQAVMLPMLAAAALFFRYRRCDSRVLPGKLWDVFLWLSAFGLLVAGGYLAWKTVSDFLGKLG